jgi:prepilin-type N-terminal cleavage/methylation domain
MEMKKLNNQGLTLIELILAMSISAIIIGAITMFMSTGSRSYQTADSEISLQTESQTIMNQITNAVQEANNVSYDATMQTLSIYHLDSDPATDDKLQIIWLKDKQLYMADILTSQKEELFRDQITPGTPKKQNLLGEYVTSFSVSPEQFQFDRTGASGSTLTVNLTLEYNQRKFVSTENIKLRNKIVNIPTSTVEPTLTPTP